MKKKIRYWLTKLLRCKHRYFEYEDAGGKACVYNHCGLDCQCSIPVYDVYCKDCGMSWTLGEDELISFFARQKRDSCR
jgi:hypothetical protein